MIIDVHAHIGLVKDFRCYGEMLLDLMNQSKIKLAAISNLEGIEFDEDHKVFFHTKYYSQYNVNKRCIKFALQHKNRFKVFTWCKPATETCDEKFKNMILKNQNIVIGLKFHPYYSKMRMDDSRIQPYLEFANKHSLTVLCHTAADEFSDAYYVYKICDKYPNVKFILAHLNMFTNGIEVAHYIAMKNNLYGDLSWVDPIYIKEIVKVASSNKLMFGSDAPIDKDKSYLHPFYKYYFNDLSHIITKDEYKNIMYRTAKKVFKIK